MLGFLKKLFSSRPVVNYADLMARGAQIADVRTPREYRDGHIKGSKNLPLQEMSLHLFKLEKNRPVITCCTAGLRSSTAASYLVKEGFKEVVDGGGWLSLRSKLP